MIVYCCSDLIFATKIRSTAEALGVTSRPARDADALQKRLEQVPDGKANDPVTGVFVDMELDDDALALIRQVKTHDAAIPVIAFGSHVAIDQLQAARQAGADEVMARSQFTANLAYLLAEIGESRA